MDGDRGLKARAERRGERCAMPIRIAVIIAYGDIYRNIFTIRIRVREKCSLICAFTHGRTQIKKSTHLLPPKILSLQAPYPPKYGTGITMAQ